MTIRTKIALFVLAVGLCEAVLLGAIGHNSVAAVARSAAEQRRIGAAIEGTRALNVSLTRLSDPSHLLAGTQGTVSEKFISEMDELQRCVATCAATACHGYEKRPPQMAAKVLEDLRGVRLSGESILAETPPSLERWVQEVDTPVRRVARMSGEMADTLMLRSREAERNAQEAEHSALFLVTLTTVFSVLVAMGLCAPIALGITRPLDRLSEQSRQIALGNLDLRAEEEGPREIALLARSLNRMLDDLSQSRKDLDAHRTSLEAEVVQGIAELRQKDEVLQRSGSLATIGLVAGTVAHDINNPLTSLLLNSEKLLETLGPDDARRAVVEDIGKDARRCRSIAMEIRSLTRQAPVEKVSCDLAELAQEAIRLVRFRAEPRRVATTLEAPPSPVICLGAPAQLMQMLVNLIGNAVDASPADGEVRIRVHGRDDQAFVEVEDRGPGIPPENRASIFKLLFTTKKEGTGLGLALCRRIVEQHEGTIGFESRTAKDGQGKGTGTLFRVTLPLKREGGR